MPETPLQELATELRGLTDLAGRVAGSSKQHKDGVLLPNVMHGTLVEVAERLRGASRSANALAGEGGVSGLRKLKRSTALRKAEEILGIAEKIEKRNDELEHEAATLRSRVGYVERQRDAALEGNDALAKGLTGLLFCTACKAECKPDDADWEFMPHKALPAEHWWIHTCEDGTRALSGTFGDEVMHA